MSLKIRLKPLTSLLLAALASAAVPFVSVADPADGASPSEANLRRTVDDLVAFGSRHAETESCLRAAYYLMGRLAEHGYAPRLQRFAEAPCMVNVIAAVPGKAAAGENAPLVIVGAHFDSISKEDPKGNAPGADDNGSGVAATLEAARLLAGRTLKAEVRFVFFGAEETGKDKVGLKGSRAYVKKELAGEKRTVLLLNPDYIGSGKPGRNSVIVLYDKKSTKLAKTVEEIGKKEVPELHVLPMRSESFPSWGDYKPFWDAGHRAVMFVREPDLSTDFDKNYHAVTDLPEHMKFGQVALVAELIRSCVEALGGGAGEK